MSSDGVAWFWFLVLVSGPGRRLSPRANTSPLDECGALVRAATRDAEEASLIGAVLADAFRHTGRDAQRFRGRSGIRRHDNSPAVGDDRQWFGRILQSGQ